MLESPALCTAPLNTLPQPRMAADGLNMMTGNQCQTHTCTLDRTRGAKFPYLLSCVIIPRSRRGCRGKATHMHLLRSEGGEGLSAQIRVVQTTSTFSPAPAFQLPSITGGYTTQINSQEEVVRRIDPSGRRSLPCMGLRQGETFLLVLFMIS